MDPNLRCAMKGKAMGEEEREKRQVEVVGVVIMK